MKTTFNESRRTFLALNSQAKSLKQCRLWVPKLPSPPKEPYMLCYIVLMENKMETATVYWGFKGRMEKKMETNCRKHASLALLNASEITLRDGRSTWPHVFAESSKRGSMSNTAEAW